MNKAAKDIIEQATRLPPDELAEVVQTLHARLFDVSDTWERDWAEEAERRSARLDSGLDEPIDADEAIADARASLARHAERRRRR